MERAYNLGVTPPVPEAVAELQKQLRDGVVADEARHEPLRVLHVVSRPGELPGRTSDALQRSVDGFCSEGAIQREIVIARDWRELEARLVDRTPPLHVVHFDGPLATSDDGLVLWLAGVGEPGAPVPLAQLARAMARGQIATLCLEAHQLLDPERGPALADAVARAAAAAHEAGVEDVVATTDVRDPWSRGRAFATFYGALATGVTLAEAVATAGGSLAHHGTSPVRFFAAAQAHVPLEESLTLGRARRRLFGFEDTLLPPHALRVADGEALVVLDRLGRGERALAITGGAGSGKTHLVHAVALQLAQQQTIDYAFCFDYTASFRPAATILEMIAPVLGVARGDGDDATRAQLAKLRCCFVLDGIADAGDERPAGWNDLLQLVRALAADGHIVLATGKRPLAADPALAEVAIAPLSVDERRLLLDRQRAQPAPDARGGDGSGDDDIDALLEATRGNPYLTCRAAALLAEEPVAAVTRVLAASEHDPVAAFQEAQWRELPAGWRELLRLCADVDGLLLDLVMIAVDNKVAFAPARSLLALVGAGPGRFADAIGSWRARGFVTRLPHGHVVDPHARRFLARQPCAASAEARLCFSQTLCEGLRLLSEHLERQNNPTLTYYLLSHRRQWVPHLEAVWFAGDHRGFLGCKRALDRLLRQAQLEQESVMWSLDLLSRSALPSADHDMLADDNLAWLALATSASSAPGAGSSDALARGAARWRAWIETISEAPDRRQALTIQQAASFLDAYHQHRNEWRDAIAVHRLVQERYVAWQAWPALIRSLKSAARCHVALGESDEALHCEERIVGDIPYADAPPGFEVQQLLDVAVTRAARGATAPAQAVLDRLRRHDEAPQLAEVIARLEARIQSRANGGYAHEG